MKPYARVLSVAAARDCSRWGVAGLKGAITSQGPGVGGRRATGGAAAAGVGRIWGWVAQAMGTWWSPGATWYPGAGGTEPGSSQRSMVSNPPTPVHTSQSALVHTQCPWV